MIRAIRRGTRSDTVASVIQVGGKWRALVRRKGFKTQCRTFPVKAQALAWARQVESDMDAGNISAQVGDLTISDVLDAYERLRERARPISDSSNEHYMLRSLRRGLGSYRLSAIQPDDLVGYATARRDEGAGPYTVNMDISKLGTVLRYGCASLRVTPPDIVGAARPLLVHLRLIGGGGRRERRPTDDEFIRVVDRMRTERGPQFADAVVFAAMTAMRRGEVCAIRKADIDQATRIVTVQRKHPRKGKVTERVPLLGAAMELALSQPDSDDGRVFPMDPGTLSKYFTWTCRALGIVDLHLHDMRHEGTSRMFEQGLGVEQVALVTGHKSWAMLKRYTQLRPEDLTRQPSDTGRSAKPRRDSPPTGDPGRRKSAPSKSRR